MVRFQTALALGSVLFNSFWAKKLFDNLIKAMVLPRKSHIQEMPGACHVSSQTQDWEWGRPRQ